MRIKLGNCRCIGSWFPNPYGKTCTCTGKAVVYLGKKCKEDYVLKIINHESLHCTMIKLGVKEQMKFDNLFVDEEDVDDYGLPKRYLNGCD